MNVLVLALLVSQVPPPAAPADQVLTLDDALARARTHPRVAQAAAAVAQASARSREAFAGYLPSGAASAAYGKTSSSGRAGSIQLTPGGTTTVSSGGVDDLYSVTVNLQAPIWDFGRTLEAVRAARASEEAERADLTVARDEQGVQVRQAYYAALASDALVSVADDTIVQMERHLAFAQGSLEVGRRTRFDVTRAQVDLANARIQKIQADNGRASSRAALAAAIGEDLDDARLEEPAGPEGPDPDPRDAVARALRSRPELAALDRRVTAADAAAAAARDAWYPTLGASGQLGWRGTEFPLSRTWQVLGTLTWPFLNGGADVARAAEARAAADASRAAREAEALQVKVEVEQAALAVIEARARRDVSKVLVAQATENLELAEGRYQAGVGSIIELADAQAALTSARAQRVRSGYDLATARARLERTVGEP
ncbi:MAG: TolC family protein [Anaeromyxobacteraceae bacterium]